ncbi:MULTISPECIES: ATPase, T2SS/T4P/T4SS family [unclassified Bacillus cereus group]|uniref:ATPase, T2SS/T4P/T4SS family n=1 Tax=unclassified Bacillus cereus group TaxID=2750818 RepID=UPI001F59CBA1|nr:MULTISPECIES: ATPase, T2SS/T4P/T4SS family [unclassified Bacillus cereus group]
MNNVKIPMVIRDNEEAFKIIELKHSVGKTFRFLEVQDMFNALIVRFDVYETGLLSLDRRYGNVKFIYKDEMDGFTDEEIVDLYVSDVQDDALPEEEVIYRRLKDKIQLEMESPGGTTKEIEKHTELLKKSTIDENARKYIMSKIRKTLITSDEVDRSDVEKISYRLFADLYGMGVLQELDDDPEMGEIMVNACTFPHFKSRIYYIKKGVKYEYDREFETLNELINVFNRVIEFNKKELNAVENAIVEADRPNQDRVNILIPDASQNYILNIRKFTNFVPNLNMMKKSGTVDSFIDRLMDVLVRGKANIGIGGPMGTGKTTFINYALTYTEKIERKVVIASVAETDVERVLKGHDVCILNVDEEKGFTFDKHLRASLRTTADRVIIPESRGGEFKQLYEANLKTRGNMFTAHALDDYSFLDMCVDMYMSSPEVGNESTIQIRNKLCKAIDIIIMMRKVGNDIRIKSISEIVANDKNEFEKMNRLYEWDFDPENPLVGQYKRTENRMSDALKSRLNEWGIPMSEMKDL